MVFAGILLPAICLAAVGTYLTADDRLAMTDVFKAAKPYTSADLQTAMYSLAGLSALGQKIADEKNICNMLNKDTAKRDVSQLFFTITASHKISNCQITLPKSVETALNKVIDESTSTTKQIYHAVFSMVHLNLKVDTAKVAAALKSALKKDDSPISHAFAFYAAELTKSDLKYFFDLIEDIVAQADEVDGKFMQFEAGVFTTSLVLDSVYKLSATFNKEPVCLKNKVEKFTNYLLSRIHTDSARNAATLLSVFKMLSTNTFHVPTVISLQSSLSVSSKQPIVKVKVCTVMGNAVDVSVSMQSAKSVKDSAVIVSKESMSPSKSDSSVHQMDFMAASPAPGFYSLVVTVRVSAGNSLPLLGLQSSSLKVKVTTQITLSAIKISISERDVPAVMIPVTYPNKLSKLLEADKHQSISINFQVLNKVTKNPMESVHQTFVSFTQEKTKQTITFIAELSADLYKFKINLNDKEKEFDYTSGTYRVDIIVGDSTIENTVVYTIASIKLELSQKSKISSDKESEFGMKREIKHTFRVPDKRPSSGISNIFNILVLVPAAILILMWLKTGININNFGEVCSFSALGFQAGLCSIFVLYYYYWTQLNMFDTIRYLTYIGVPTFLFGNRVLKCISSKRK